MSEYLIQGATLTAIGDAIREKRGESIQYAPGDMPGKIRTISGGGGSVQAKDINFYDYDGTIVEAWTLSELQGKTALPNNPTHDGLTAQGWNWTLSQLKSQNTKMNVGQMYITSDGKTRIYIHMEEGRLNPYFGLCPNGSVDIDWGDNTAHGTLTGTSTTTPKFLQHTYASGGDYVITLTVTGSFGVSNDDYMGYTPLLLRAAPNTDYDDRNGVYANCIRKIHLGSGITSIDYGAFRSSSSLAAITIPSGVTSIADFAFIGCRSLAAVTIPNGVTSIGELTFPGCSSLTTITIPSGVTSIGNEAFSECSLLAAVTIPSSVTSIGSNAFSYCNSLTTVTIPSGVTSISGNAFFYCSSLAAVTIPSTVTSISSGAFNGCRGLGELRFTRSTPPTAQSGAFIDIPTDCKIYVPSASLTQYRNATNYPSPSTYTYIGY